MGVYMKARYAAAAMISAALALGSLTGCGGGGAQEPAGSAGMEAQEGTQEDSAKGFAYDLSKVAEYQGVMFKMDPSWEILNDNEYDYGVMIDRETNTHFFIRSALYGQTETLEGGWNEYFAANGKQITKMGSWDENGLVSANGRYKHMLIHTACETATGKGFLLCLMYSNDLLTDDQAKSLFEDICTTIYYTPADTTLDYKEAFNQAQNGGGSFTSGEAQGSTDAEMEQQSAAPETPSYGEGTYKVGADLPAGEYKLTSVSDDAYWEVKNSSDADADIVGNDIFSGSAYVTVYDGQYLTLRRCTAEPAA